MGELISEQLQRHESRARLYRQKDVLPSAPRKLMQRCSAVRRTPTHYTRLELWACYSSSSAVNKDNKAQPCQHSIK